MLYKRDGMPSKQVPKANSAQVILSRFPSGRTGDESPEGISLPRDPKVRLGSPSWPNQLGLTTLFRVQGGATPCSSSSSSKQQHRPARVKWAKMRIPPRPKIWWMIPTGAGARNSIVAARNGGCKRHMISKYVKRWRFWRIWGAHDVRGGGHLHWKQSR